MANAKKKTTFAKLNRENAVRERRLRKEAKREARKHAPTAPMIEPVSELVEVEPSEESLDPTATVSVDR